MPSMLRRMEKRMLKKVGFRREPAVRWEVRDGKPFQVVLKPHERMIENVITGVRYGPHFPHRRDARHVEA